MPEQKKIRQISREFSPQPKIIESAEGEDQKEQEKAPAAIHEQEPDLFVASAPATKPASAPSESSRASFKSEELREIERILSEGLHDTYGQLPLRLQEKFREHGEKTALTISVLLRAVHVNILKIMKLIRQWLSVIPQVNRFFLEQEAKIKTDKIIALHERAKK